MEDLTEIKIDINSCEHEINSLKHRMDNQEQQSKAFNELVMSVQRLADNMASMLEQQKCQNERLKKLEEVPTKRYESIIATIISVTVGGAIGYAMSLFL